MMHAWYTKMVGGPNAKVRDQQGHDDWMARVYPALLKLFNNATHGQRPLLRSLLFTEGWIDSPHPQIRDIAHALLARAFILDGRILDLPSGRQGIILLDWGLRHYKYNWASYYQNAYRLIQQLAVMTPLKIYSLGSTRLIKEIGRRVGDARILSRDLQPRRTSPRLLMPLFDHKVFGEPKQTHFILVLTPMESVLGDVNQHRPPDIIDLPDVVERATGGVQAIDPKLQKILSSSMYREDEKEAARRQIASQASVSNWEWKQKLFLVTPDKAGITKALNRLIQVDVIAEQTKQSDGIDTIFSLIDVNDSTFTYDIETIIAALMSQLGRSLHTLSEAEWEQDLLAIWKDDEKSFEVDPSFRLSHIEGVKAQLDHWIKSLEDVTKAHHPRDITMTIVWTIMALSKQDLTQAVTCVHEWLISDNPQAQIMGVACTKMLYNFYHLDHDLYTNSEAYHVLLSLLPDVLSLERGRDSSEFSQLLNVVMIWAREQGWSRYMLESVESPLAQAVKNITDRRGVADLRRLVTLQELFGLVARLYKASHVSWPEFRQFLRQIAAWYGKTPLDRRPQQLVRLQEQMQPEGVSKMQVQGAVSLLDELVMGISPFYATPLGIDLFTALAARQAQELAQQEADDLEQKVTNIRNVANFIRLYTTRHRSHNDKMPALSDNGQYGVILIRGAPQGRGSDLRSHVIAFVKDLHARLKEKECRKIVITIHHIGQSDMLYKDNSAPPTQLTLRLADKASERALLISPTLEAYRLEHVAFVLIVSDSAPLDLADWRDEGEWAEKIYLFGRGRSGWMDAFYSEGNEKRKQRIKTDVKQLTDTIMDVIGC